jgi:hypothetical protein
MFFQFPFAHKKFPLIHPVSSEKTWRNDIFPLTFSGQVIAALTIHFEIPDSVIRHANVMLFVWMRA